MDTSNFIEIIISSQPSGVTQEGFGTIMIVGSNAVFEELSRTYSSLDAVGEDFEATDDEYKAANAIFAQDPAPDQIKIGRRQTPVAEVQTLTFSADFVTGNEIDLDVHGTAITTVPFNTDHDTTMGDLAAAIQASSYVVTATVTAARVITITAQTAGIPTEIENIEITGGASQPTATLATTTENVGITEDLIAINQEDPDWYGLITTSRDEDEILLASAYIETKRKLFFAFTDDETVKDSTTTDIAALLEAKSYKRTGIFYNETSSDFFDAGSMGRFFPEEPGSIIVALKKISGITASNMTETERSNLISKKANFYVTYLDKDIIDPRTGTASDGTYFDETRDTDWLHSELETEIFNLLYTTNKLPYTDPGGANIESVIRKCLSKANRKGIINDDYDVIVPKVADISDSDKSNRLFPDITFTATYQSAIQGVKPIRGTISI